ncbi:unnamed protein product [Owenia fusiformis]|uniref:Uncharacterized protein n=1 Tax=Owenia fusiformis TaxID=6347 RepID=A0A8J1XV59_OWEFU|nr:unnamed protein product [Owenia fusiformis]
MNRHIIEKVALPKGDSPRTKQMKELRAKRLAYFENRGASSDSSAGPQLNHSLPEKSEPPVRHRNPGLKTTLPNSDVRITKTTPREGIKQKKTNTPRGVNKTLTAANTSSPRSKGSPRNSGNKGVNPGHTEFNPYVGKSQKAKNYPENSNSTAHLIRNSVTAGNKNHGETQLQEKDSASLGRSNRNKKVNANRERVDAVNTSSTDGGYVGIGAKSKYSNINTVKDDIPLTQISDAFTEQMLCKDKCVSDIIQSRKQPAEIKVDKTPKYIQHGDKQKIADNWFTQEQETLYTGDSKNKDVPNSEDFDQDDVSDIELSTHRLDDYDDSIISDVIDAQEYSKLQYSENITDSRGKGNQTSPKTHAVVNPWEKPGAVKHIERRHTSDKTKGNTNETMDDFSQRIKPRTSTAWTDEGNLGLRRRLSNQQLSSSSNRSSDSDTRKHKLSMQRSVNNEPKISKQTMKYSNLSMDGENDVSQTYTRGIDQNVSKQLRKKTNPNMDCDQVDGDGFKTHRPENEPYEGDYFSTQWTRHKSKKPVAKYAFSSDEIYNQANQLTKMKEMSRNASEKENVTHNSGPVYHQHAPEYDSPDPEYHHPVPEYTQVMANKQKYEQSQNDSNLVHEEPSSNHKNDDFKYATLTNEDLEHIERVTKNMHNKFLGSKSKQYPSIFIEENNNKLDLKTKQPTNVSHQETTINKNKDNRKKTLDLLFSEVKKQECLVDALDRPESPDRYRNFIRHTLTSPEPVKFNQLSPEHKSRTYRTRTNSKENYMHERPTSVEPGGHQRTLSSPGLSALKHIDGIRGFHENRTLQNKSPGSHGTSASKENLKLEGSYSTTSLDRYFSSIQDISSKNSVHSENFEPIPEPSIEETPRISIDHIFDEKLAKQSPISDSGYSSKDLGSREKVSRPKDVSEPNKEIINTGIAQNEKQNQESGGVTARLEKLGINPSLFIEKSKNTLKDPAKVNDDKDIVTVCPDCQGVNKPYVTWCLECGCVLIGVDPVPRKLKSSQRPKVQNNDVRSLENHNKDDVYNYMENDTPDELIEIDDEEETPNKTYEKCNNVKELYNQDELPLDSEKYNDIQVEYKDTNPGEYSDDQSPRYEQDNEYESENDYEDQNKFLDEEIHDEEHNDYTKGKDYKDHHDFASQNDYEGSHNDYAYQKGYDDSQNDDTNQMDYEDNHDDYTNQKDYEDDHSEEDYDSFFKDYRKHVREYEEDIGEPMLQEYENSHDNLDNVKLSSSLNQKNSTLPDALRAELSLTLEDSFTAKIPGAKDKFQKLLEDSFNSENGLFGKHNRTQSQESRGSEYEIFERVNDSLERTTSRNNFNIPMLNLSVMSDHSDDDEEFVAEDSPKVDQAIGPDNGAMFISPKQDTERSAQNTQTYREEGAMYISPRPGAERSDQETQSFRDAYQENKQVNRLLQEAGFKRDNLPSPKPPKPTKSKAKPAVSSKVKETIESKSYTRHWQKSSTAWSSYNPRELKSRSSLPLRSSMPSPVSNKSKSNINRPNKSQENRPGSATRNRGNSAKAANIRAQRNKPRSFRSSVLEEEVHMIESGGESRDQGSNEPVEKGQGDFFTVGGAKLSKGPVSEIRRSEDPYAKYIAMSPRIEEGDFSIWLCLPDEVLLSIFSYLPHSVLARCALVCQQFYRVAMDDSLWRSISLANKHNVKDDWLVCIGQHRPRQLNLAYCKGKRVTSKGLRELFRLSADTLQELDITGCNEGELKGDSLILHAFSRCTEIRKLDASWCNIDNNQLAVICDNATRLESISLKGCQNITDEGVEMLALTHGTSLESLDLCGCIQVTNEGIYKLSVNCKGLLSLSLGECYKLSDVCIGQLSMSLCGLEVLDLRGCKQIKDDCIRRVVRNCPRLKSLTLGSCPYITDGALVEIATYMTGLRHLDVRGSKKVTDVGIRNIAHNCRFLTELDLSSTAITQKSVFALASYAIQRLEVLKLNFCRDITEGALAKLAKNCKRLHMLELFGGRRIRDNGIARIQMENKNLVIKM